MLTKTLRLSAPTLAALAFSLAAHATSTASPAGSVPAADSLPAALKAAAGKGVRVVKSFPVSPVLTGWVIETGGKSAVAYTTGDGAHLMLGNLYDSKASNLTLKHAEDEIPKPDLKAAWSKLGGLAYISEGSTSAKKIVYVFTDLRCGYCQKLWAKTRGAALKDVQLRWIPVAILGPDSAAAAEAALTDATPAQALHRAYDRFGETAPAAPASLERTSAARKQLAANLALMSEMGLQGTPALVYKDAAGAVRAVPGLPSDGALTQILSGP